MKIILIYSFLITILLLFEGTDYYYHLSDDRKLDIDIVISGPVGWFTILLLFFSKQIGLTEKIIKIIEKQQKKPYSYKKLDKIVKKCIKTMLKNEFTNFSTALFDINKWNYLIDGNFYGSIKDYVSNAPIAIKMERAYLIAENKKNLMEILKKYFYPVTKKELLEDGIIEWYIDDLDVTLWKLRKEVYNK